MPWITQEIKRPGRKPEHLFCKFKKSGDQLIRTKVIKLRKQIKDKIKPSYMTYREGLLELKKVPLATVKNCSHF